MLRSIHWPHHCAERSPLSSGISILYCTISHFRKISQASSQRSWSSSPISHLIILHICKSEQPTVCWLLFIVHVTQHHNFCLGIICILCVNLECFRVFLLIFNFIIKMSLELQLKSVLHIYCKYARLFKSLGSVRLVFKEINTFILWEDIKSITSDSKDIYNATKYFYFKWMLLFWTFNS